MKKIVIASLMLVACCSSINAQLGITSYATDALAINTSKQHKFTGEFKCFLNSSMEDLLFEVSGMYNFKRAANHQFSVGLGVNFAPFASPDQFNCYVIPMQLEIFPLQNFKQLSVVFELTPEIYLEDNINLRHLWGIRYTFQKRSKK